MARRPPAPRVNAGRVSRPALNSRPSAPRVQQTNNVGHSKADQKVLPEESAAVAQADAAPKEQSDETAKLIPFALKRPEVGGTIVNARDRFADLVQPKPWRRYRRRILIGLIVVLVLLVAAAVFMFKAPQVQVKQVTVTGTTYLNKDELQLEAAKSLGLPMVTAPGNAVLDHLKNTPGVAGVEVIHHWPSTLQIAVTETKPEAIVKQSGQPDRVIGPDGQTLPLAPDKAPGIAVLNVGAGSSDPNAAVATQLQVLRALPAPIHAQVVGVSATSRDDVTLQLKLDDNDQRTVIWGSPKDMELKAKVLGALLKQQAKVIDVSSPTAPVTRN